MAKGGYQRQRLQAKKDAERRARKRARRQKVAAQWVIGIIVLALIGTVVGLAAFGGKKKAATTPSATPSATPSPSPTPSYLIPGCTQPSSAKPNGKQFKKAPAMTIDKTKTYVVTMKTTCGTMTWKLDPKIAPVTVNNIVFLVKQHFYDNTIFHRVQVVTAAEAAANPSGGGAFAIVQGGDPTGTGSGGPGYSYTGESPPKGEKYSRGTLAIANSGSLSTDGSQFFVVVQDWPTLPPQYTVFGTVTGSTSFATLDRMTLAQGGDLGQGLGISPNPAIKIISATVTVQ